MFFEKIFSCRSERKFIKYVEYKDFIPSFLIPGRINRNHNTHNSEYYSYWKEEGYFYKLNLSLPCTPIQTILVYWQNRTNIEIPTENSLNSVKVTIIYHWRSPYLW